MEKEITIHHYTRAAQWAEGEVQVFATVKMTDGQHTATSTDDLRFNSPRLAHLFKQIDEEILKEMGGTAKHAGRLPSERIPGEARGVQLKSDIPQNAGELAAMRAAGQAQDVMPQSEQVEIVTRKPAK